MEEATQQFLSFVPSQISKVGNGSYLCPVAIKEVKALIFHMNLENALGSDGFPGRFCQACWDITALELLEAI